MGSHDHLHGTGMSEAWNDPERPPRPDRGGDAWDHMIIRDDHATKPGAGEYRRKWPDPLRRAAGQGLPDTPWWKSGEVSTKA